MPSSERVEIQNLRIRLEAWAELWGVPRLPRDLALRTSTRLRTSLGSYRAHRGEITLAAWLLDSPGDLLHEVFCHEAAHAAVHALYGQRRARPHGPEWRALMRKADFAPRVRVPWSALPASRRLTSDLRGLWEHRCPVCQATRLARTRVTRWRCRACREQALEGSLAIRRLPTAIGIDR